MGRSKKRIPSKRGFRKLSLGMLFLGKEELWFLLLLLFDQISKIFALELLPFCKSRLFPYGGVSLGSWGGIEGSLVLVSNSGAAWGLLCDSPGILLAIRLFLVAMLFFWLRAAEGPKKWALCTILAGACSNIVDVVVRNGGVVDMIHFTFWGYSYPVFNLADSMLCLGLLWLLLLEAKGER